MNHLTNASKIGTLIPRTGLSYCADDNTYTEYTFHIKAWACSLDDRPLKVSEPEGDLFTLLFS